MDAVEEVSVHIAVLAIAPTGLDLGVIERATSAGHQIMDQEVVRDDEAAIHDQLVRWIADPDVDAVIVTGESARIAPALAELIQDTLPGFGDLQGVQCASTKVFMSSAGIDRILEYLANKPEAVPVSVRKKEITAGGSGVPPKPPAQGGDVTRVGQAGDVTRIAPAAPVVARNRSATGKNVIRKDADPPTRPIELAKLERQIALSSEQSANDAVTKQIDLAKVAADAADLIDDGWLDGGADDDILGTRETELPRVTTAEPIGRAKRPPTTPPPTVNTMDEAPTGSWGSFVREAQPGVAKAGPGDITTTKSQPVSEELIAQSRRDDATARTRSAPEGKSRSAPDTKTKWGPASGEAPTTPWPSGVGAPVVRSKSSAPESSRARTPTGRSASPPPRTRSGTGSQPTSPSPTPAMGSVTARPPASASGTAPPSRPGPQTPASGQPIAGSTSQALAALGSQTSAPESHAPGDAPVPSTNTWQQSVWGRSSPPTSPPDTRQDARPRSPSAAPAEPRAKSTSAAPPEPRAKSPSEPRSISSGEPRAKSPSEPRSMWSSEPRSKSPSEQPEPRSKSPSEPRSMWSSEPRSKSPSEPQAESHGMSSGESHGMSSGESRGISSGEPRSKSPSEPQAESRGMSPSEQPEPRAKSPSEQPEPRSKSPSAPQAPARDRRPQPPPPPPGARSRPITGAQPTTTSPPSPPPVAAAAAAVDESSEAAVVETSAQAASSPFAAPAAAAAAAAEPVPTDISSNGSSPAATAAAAETISAVTTKARQPTPPAFDHIDLRALTEQANRQGETTHPIKVRKSNLGLIIALLVLLGAGAIGAVLFLRSKEAPATGNAKPTEAKSEKAAATQIDAAVVATVSIDAPVEATKEPATGDATNEPNKGSATPTNTATTTGPTPSNTTNTTKTTGTGTATPANTTKTTTGTTKTTGKGSAAPAGSDADQPKASNPTGDPECDEVQCVMSKYDRPCCERYRPREPNAKPGIPEDLDKGMIRAGVETVKPRIIACGEEISTKGTVKVSVHVTDAGVVREASVTEAPSTELGECVAAALRKAKFAKSMNGASFVYPFVF